MKDVVDRQAYLRELRERAMERMRADEAEVKPLSRRESLRWLGMAAVAAVGARPMRALAVSGALHERSERVASLRYPAPQYGAPVLPSPSLPFEKGDDAPKLWAGTVRTVEMRSELAAPGNWAKDNVLLLDSDGKALVASYDPQTNTTEARAIFYKGPWVKPHALDVVTRETTQMTYVVPGGQSFYVEDDGEFWAFLMQDKTLFVRKSYFKTKGAGDAAVHEALRGFVKKVDDAKIRTDESNVAAIDLSNVYVGWYSSLYSLKAKDGRVTIWPSNAVKPFTVDWKAKRLVETDPADNR